MTTRASATSQENYRVTITPNPDEDPTTFPVRLAFPASGQPPATWINASWEVGGPPYVVTIGLPDADLDPGAYDVYVEIDTGGEVPRFLADRLVIFDEITTFASVAELADTLRTDIDPEDPAANQALIDATAYIRESSNQVVSFVEDDVVTLSGREREGILLPQAPVINVNEVTLLDPDGVETELTSTDYRWDDSGILWRTAGTWPLGHGNVLVSYDHGYETIPQAVRSLCCRLAARNYASLAAVAAGISSETIGGYSVTYGSETSSATELSDLPASWASVIDKLRHGGRFQSA